MSFKSFLTHPHLKHWHLTFSLLLFIITQIKQRHRFMWNINRISSVGWWFTFTSIIKEWNLNDPIQYKIFKVINFFFFLERKVLVMEMYIAHIHPSLLLSLTSYKSYKKHKYTVVWIFTNEWNKWYEFAYYYSEERVMVFCQLSE